MAEQTPKRARPEPREPPTCDVCAEFLYRPYMFQCGHTLCQMCIFKVAQCPMCNSAAGSPIRNFALEKILENDWPDEWKKASENSSLSGMISAYEAKHPGFKVSFSVVGQATNTQQLNCLEAAFMLCDDNSHAGLINVLQKFTCIKVAVVAWDVVKSVQSAHSGSNANILVTIKNEQGGGKMSMNLFT